MPSVFTSSNWSVNALRGVALLALIFLLLPLLGLFLPMDGGAPRDLDIAAPMMRSLLVAGLATFIALLAGTPLAWWLARSRARWRWVIQALVALPLVLPPVVSGVALIGVFGRGGLLGLDLAFSHAALVLSAAYVAFPFFVLAAAAAFRASSRELEDAAATLGASPSRILRRIVLPQAAPMLLAGGVLTFARAIGEFGATVTFAGNFADRRTLPLEVFFQLEARGDFYASIIISQALLGVSLLLVLMLGFVEGRNKVRDRRAA